VTPNSAGLDGTRFTCKAETVSGEIYSETIAIRVKGILCQCDMIKDKHHNDYVNA
jgi:hypothetical protein